MLKKIIRITGIILLSTSALADKQTAEIRDSFYLKANIGANKIKNAKQNNTYPEYNVDIPSNKSKSKISPVLSIAAGFYLNDYVRHDLSFGYQKVNFKRSVVDFVVFDAAGNITNNGTLPLKRKASIYSLMFNSYVDLPINDSFDFFLGGGVGIARIKEKAIQQIIVDNINISEETEKSRNRNNFAYSLITGISYKITDNTHVELSYSWQDIGKTRYKDKEVTKNRYRGHSILTGIRYNI